MTHFNEQLRYEYPLTSNSIIIDGGGYEGTWFRQMFEKYKCWIHVYEPAKEFFHQCSIVAAAANPDGDKIFLNNAALSDRDGIAEIGVNGDSTGIFNPANKQVVETVSAPAIVSYLKPIDVFKLNIEGSEYEVLESLIATEQIKHIKNIQVQFHFLFPHSKARWEAIKADLNKTHEAEWDSEPVWQNFKLR